jgi:tetratricopeptide (TPR) repeat protein
LKRYDDAIAAFERAVTIYTAVNDDAGIARAARSGYNCDMWRGRMPAARSTMMRGLQALSKDAARERALLLSAAVVVQTSPAHLDQCWQFIDEATAIAERLADPVVLGMVLTGKSYGHRLCGELEAAQATAEEALHLVDVGSVWARADLLANHVYSLSYLGRLSTCDAWLPELHTLAARAGHHGAQWAHDSVQNAIALARSGDLRAFMGRTRPALDGPILRFVVRSYVGLASLYLGEIGPALEHLADVVEEQPNEHWLQGVPEGNLLAATALAGHHERARALIPSVIQRLPVSGRRNAQGAYLALDACVSGLALIGDRDRCGAFYPLTLDYIRTGQVYTVVSFPGNPQLVAALAADAAGLVDQSREHFETALRQAREVPVRILQPNVLYWYGRSLATAADSADRLRGRAMVEAALTDFRTLEMVLHATLAEQFLREGQ